MSDKSIEQEVRAVLRQNLPILRELRKAITDVEKCVDREKVAHEATLAAVEHARAMHASALKEGWSEKQLRALRLVPAPAKRRRGKTNHKSSRPAAPDTTNGDSAQPTAAEPPPVQPG
ncbi:hypothetical protein [Prauserella marina]|nr:hypothetical protein [Prauserella marina]